MSDKKPRGLTEAQKTDARAAFESGTESLRAISKRIGCRYATLHAIREREAWTVSVSVSLSGSSEPSQMRDRAQAKVIDIATGRAIEKLESSGVVDAIADSLRSGLAKHAEIGLRLVEAGDGLLQDFIATEGGELGSTREQDGREVITRQGRIEQFAQLVAGLKAAIALNREIAGKTAGMPSVDSVPSEADSGKLVIEHVRLEPTKIPVDEKGRQISA